MKTKLLQKLLYLFFGLLLVFPLQAQWNASATLNVNNVEADVRIGDLWFDGGNSRYIVPNDGMNEVGSIFAGGIWYGGFDPGGELKLASSTYYSNAYSAGPLNPNNGTTDVTSENNWDRIFEITAAEVTQHVQDFEDNGVIDGPVPYNILGWPGLGNLEFYGVHDFQLPNQELAPFVDRDGDGYYEPLDGDYPKMKGDQAFWWVFNDVGTTATDFPPAQLEFHAMAFAYASSDVDINNTTFYDFKLISRAQTAVDSFVVGLWVDPDLGCYSDDYIGCSPAHDMAFVYNGDEVDEDCNGPDSGYGEELPVLGIRVLKGMEDETGTGPGFSNFLYSATEVPQITEWDTINSIYQNLTGTWGDGTPLTQGGDGYNPMSGLPPYDYALDGSEIDGVPWTACTANMPATDYRMLISSGDVLMEPGDARYFSFAVIWSQDVEYPCPDLEDFFDASDDIADFYESIGEGLFTGVSDPDFGVAFAECFPNPATDYLQIRATTSAALERVEFFDSAGRLIHREVGGLSGNLEFSTADWPRGVCFYRLYSGEGVQTGKLILQ
ncbi:MAG: T9SS type A sorting domain-containing protein [Bacteroidetes bacterium]|nr:T9SS type A sorting domain-containing protein [Bacteroidota bacterium]